MAYNHACKRRILQQRFDPLNAREVEMVCGFIEQQNVRLLNQRRRDGEAFAPASRERHGRSFEVRKTGATQRGRESRRPLALRHRSPIQRRLPTAPCHPPQTRKPARRSSAWFPCVLPDRRRPASRLPAESPAASTCPNHSDRLTRCDPLPIPETKYR